MTATQDAYDRGVLDGRVAIRLDHHDDQIAATNVLLARTIDISQTMASTVQTLTEARVTDAATRLTTAQAVKDAKDAKEAGWPPAAKLIAVIGSAATVVAILWSVLSSLPSMFGG